MSLVFALLTSTLAQAGACLAGSSTAEVAARLEAAEAGYTALDEVKFVDALDEAALLLPCVRDVLDLGSAARYHRTEGLRLYTVGDQGAAMDAMRAARILDPRYRFSDDLLPKEHELRVRYDALPILEGPFFRVAKPRAGSLRFDGVVTQNRPLERATVFQIVATDGVVAETAYLYPGQPLPAYPATRRTRNALLAASGGVAVLSAVAYGLAWGANSAFRDPNNTTITYDELSSLQDQTVLFTGLSGGLLAVAVGGGTAAFLVREQ